MNKKNNVFTAYNHTVWQVSPGFKVDAFNDRGGPNGENPHGCEALLEIVQAH